MRTNNRLLTEKDFWFIFVSGFVSGGLFYYIVNKTADAIDAIKMVM